MKAANRENERKRQRDLQLLQSRRSRASITWNLSFRSSASSSEAWNWLPLVGLVPSRYAGEDVCVSLASGPSAGAFLLLLLLACALASCRPPGQQPPLACPPHHRPSHPRPRPRPCGLQPMPAAAPGTLCTAHPSPQPSAPRRTARSCQELSLQLRHCRPRLWHQHWLRLKPPAQIGPRCRAAVVHSPPPCHPRMATDEAVEPGQAHRERSAARSYVEGIEDPIGG
mmetsp:Transcript_30880/g.49575  ORF Transcript_30880/g.49575 Transcript_30880/m.49575 type:complete len:226 (+) Transcript_30880:147-824(+)